MKNLKQCLEAFLPYSFSLPNLVLFHLPAPAFFDRPHWLRAWKRLVAILIKITGHIRFKFIFMIDNSSDKSLKKLNNNNTIILNLAQSTCITTDNSCNDCCTIHSKSLIANNGNNMYDVLNWAQCVEVSCSLLFTWTKRQINLLYLTIFNLLRAT